MATSLLLLLDDIASVLDDVALLTKAAAKKTAGVIGDDLALNAHQVAGVDSGRELRVVWRVALGSLANKAILVPAALALSWLAPWAVAPLLMLGGVYLCVEGMEKILHRPRRHAPDGAATPADGHGHPLPAPAEATAGLVALERDKIRGAIRTDFILSAEIIVIALGVAAAAPFGVRAAVLAAVGLGMTVGVYGLVAAIVKLDDLGAALARRRPALVAAVGRGIVAAAPWLMRALSIAGTAAMFLVGGGIVVHQWPALHEAIEWLLARIGVDTHGDATLGLQLLVKSAEAACGILLGIIVVAAVGIGRKGRALVGRTA